MNPPSTDLASNEKHIAWLIEHGRALLAEHHATTCQDSQFGIQELVRLFRTNRLQSWQQALLHQQVQLRWRSRSRFPNPTQWLWTDRSLSQASDYWSAKYKASLFPAGQPVVDACCGGGSDLVALADRGPTIGIDGNPQLVSLAKDNAWAQGYQVSVAARRLPEEWTDQTTWLSIDPDRRPTGGRTTRAKDFSPALKDVFIMAETCQGALIKLAPSTEFNDELRARIDRSAQRIWLGNQGECRQQLLLTGQLQQNSLRTAVLCEPAGLATTAAAGDPPLASTKSPPLINHLAVETFSAELPVVPEIVHKPNRFVLDLHSTLHAAELQAAWAAAHGYRALGQLHGYYTADHYRPTPWGQAFEVLDEFAWDDRKIRKWLRRYGAGPVEVKIRAAQQQALGIDANACQRRYSAQEGRPVTLLITRVGRRLRGIAARRPDRELAACGVVE